MVKNTDTHIIGSTLYLLPVETRMPLRFGSETLTSVTCARVSIRVQDGRGRVAEGWGETPLSVQWVWPSALPYKERYDALVRFCEMLAEAWAGFEHTGHPIEIGHAFIEKRLPRVHERFNRKREGCEPMPWLAALVCASPYDIALHDAYGMVHDISVYETYNDKYMNLDLSAYLSPAEDSHVSFTDQYPADYLVFPRRNRLPVWHLVGGMDPIKPEDFTGKEPRDGRPVFLRDWIREDGLKCLKVKLRGDDRQWDYDRLVTIGQIAHDCGCYWLSADFNCTVTDPVYVTDFLDRLLFAYPHIYAMLLYVEQPFPYDLEANRIDVRSVSARKPLFMDESAHDWRQIRLGRSLGWTGVALKTCKTQTGALLSLAWARAHGMTLMVQDLTNPMLSQIPHVLLAAHAGTIMGVESNAMQFYPSASTFEAAIHPGVYRRIGGALDLFSVQGPGFGYGRDTLGRRLPKPHVRF